MKVSTKATTTATKARGKQKSTFSELATCPVDGAGWCPYPFTMAQLRRRLKAKAAAAAVATEADAKTKRSAAKSTGAKVRQPVARASS
jgi:hypothetical protein